MSHKRNIDTGSILKYLGFLPGIAGGLCINCHGFSAEDLGSKFISYNKSHLQEKLYVHTDKSFYLAGEVLGSRCMPWMGF
jgi:hypothetical protein